MNDLENKLALAARCAHRRPLPASEECFVAADALTRDEVAAIREFFELIASWEVEEFEHGN